MFQEKNNNGNLPAEIDVLTAAAPSITLTVTDNHCQHRSGPREVRAAVVFEAFRARERHADAGNSRLKKVLGIAHLNSVQ